MGDHWEAVVIGGCVAKNVHNSPDFLHSVEACDWRAHDLSVVNKINTQDFMILHQGFLQLFNIVILISILN